MTIVFPATLEVAAIQIGAPLPPPAFYSSDAGAIAQNLLDPMHRYPDPVGPIIQLIPKFVDRLLEHVGVEQDFQLATVLGNERGALCRIEVSLEERPRTPYLPKPRPRLHRGEVALAQGSAANVLQQGAEGSIMKRAQHPGNVANHRALAPA